MPEQPHETPDSECASSGRASVNELRVQRAAFISEPVATALLDAMPGPAVVLNTSRQIVAINGVLKDLLGVQDSSALLGIRLGESLDCIHAREMPGGCGTSRSCSECGALGAMLECLALRTRTTKECRVQTKHEGGGGALDYRVHATFMTVNRQDFAVIGLEDISGEKRRHVLERTFFHDLLNTCGGVYGLAELLDAGDNDPATEGEYKHDLHRLSGVVIEQIQSQRQLLAAERGELLVQAQVVDVANLIEDAAALYRHHEVGDGRTIRVQPMAPLTLNTDPVLLGRVVGNLVKNALEATPAGGTVTIGCVASGGTATITVHNAGMIPERVQLQIFQRSFSTKGGEGRGIGTYSVRLLAEQYLQGKVHFTSTEKAGTAFVAEIPNWQPVSKAA